MEGSALLVVYELYKPDTRFMRLFSGSMTFDEVNSEEAVIRGYVDTGTGSINVKDLKCRDKEETKKEVGIPRKRKQPEVAREMMAAKPLVSSKIIQHS